MATRWITPLIRKHCKTLSKWKMCWMDWEMGYHWVTATIPRFDVDGFLNIGNSQKIKLSLSRFVMLNILRGKSNRNLKAYNHGIFLADFDSRCWKYVKKHAYRWCIRGHHFEQLKKKIINVVLFSEWVGLKDNIYSALLCIISMDAY